MKFILSRIFTIVFFSVSFLISSAQQNYFTDIAESAAKKTGQKRVIIPNKFRTVSLDTAGLVPFFRGLPSEQSILNDHNTTPVLLIPMPDGSTAKFHVWESSTMAPALAAAYPELKTFTGQGIDDPTATIKLDWTEFGFHAMIQSPVTGDIFIDPYDQKTVINYISYYKADFKKKGKFTELPPINTGAKSNTNPDNIEAGVCIGTQLRTYRLAVACTGEYAQAATGLNNPTKAQTLAKIVTSINRVNSVYEKEVSIRLVLVANETDVIFTTPATQNTDPFFGGNDDADILIGQSQTEIDARIGNANYDIGHTFSTGAGGLAGPGVVCKTGQKASGITGSPEPFGDAYDIDYVCHEMGHQFGCDHTFNSTEGFCGSLNQGSPTTNAEPASGITIMAYAGICSPDDIDLHSIPYFHAVSFDQLTQYSVNGTGNGCAVKTNTGNTAPVVNAGTIYSIPISTPFVLTGSATDANGDALTYSWEQTDIGGASGFGAWNAPTGNAPIFRSFAPVTTPVRYFPKLSNQIAGTTTIGEILPSYARTMHFRLTARDNRAGGGGVCYSSTTVTTVAGTGPFTVSYPTASGVVWNVNEFQTVTWDPAGTAAAPINCANVNIQLSIDGGLTFPVTILNNTPNDGSEEIQVPNNVITTARIRVIAATNIFYDFSNTNFRIQTPAIASFSLNRPEPVAVCAASSGTATLKTAALAGFSSTISLSGSLNPAGTTISFGSASISPGSSTTVTLNVVSPVAPGVYTIRVTATGGSITKTRDIIFVVGSGGATPASLSLPANDAIGVSSLTSFNWTAVTGITSYTLEISTTSDFAAIVQTVPGITTLPFTLVTPLAENTIYFWRVKSINICGTGTPTATPNRFKTGINSCRQSADVPKVISATGAPTINSTIVIPASAGVTINDLNISIQGDHGYVHDLTFTLIGPNNTTVKILDTLCEGYAGFNINLDDQSANTIIDCPPLTGQIVTPLNPLSVFNGLNSAGTWTLRIKDNAPPDGGNLTGWSLNINSTGATDCIVISKPLLTTYTFTGTGNWNVASNWSGNEIPPAILPANSAIVINPTGGPCVLNVSQQIAPGASLTVMTGKNLVVPGTLTIQ